VRYGLKVASKDRLNSELDEAAAGIDQSVIDGILHRLFHERFSDSTFFAYDGTPKNAMECHLTWRGGVRRGKVSWNQSGGENSESDLHDWEVYVDLGGVGAASGAGPDIPRVLWRPAELRRDELEAIRRHHVLSTDNAIREKFGDMVRAALHSSTVVMARIVNRIFLEDGRIVIDDFDYNFSDDARTSPTLSGLFSTMLEPLFEVRYPHHPYFLRRLGIAEVASLVSDLYSGSRQRHSEVQQLAQTFGLPLGIVKLNEGIYIPETEERLAALPPVSAISKLLEGRRDVELSDVYNELKKPPYGYVREAQQLILSAMVSQRMIEFVTSKGDRINSRSLDLKIIWDDIVGIAHAHEATAPSKHLNHWAKLFAKGEFKSLTDDASSRNLEAGFAEWLAKWDEDAVLERFGRIPAESINTPVWKKYTRATNTLGVAAAAIRSCVSRKLALHECLSRVSEAFLDDVENFKRAGQEMNLVSAYVRGFHETTDITMYTAVAEYVGQSPVEDARESVRTALEEFQISPSDDRLRNVGYQWAKFHRLFTEHYVSAHDAVMRSHQLQSRVEEVLRSDDWWEFQNLISGRGRRTADGELVFRLVKMSRDLGCSADTAGLLKTQPFCECGFSISKAPEWSSLPENLEASLVNALNGLKAELADNREALITEITSLVAAGSDPSIKDTAGALTAALESGSFPLRFPPEELTLLRESIKAAARKESGSLHADDGLDSVEDWFASEGFDKEQHISVN
jgi:hypothetical protein